MASYQFLLPITWRHLFWSWESTLKPSSLPRIAWRDKRNRTPLRLGVPFNNSAWQWTFSPFDRKIRANDLYKGFSIVRLDYWRVKTMVSCNMSQENQSIEISVHQHAACTAGGQVRKSLGFCRLITVHRHGGFSRFWDSARAMKNLKISQNHIPKIPKILLQDCINLILGSRTNRIQ